MFGRRLFLFGGLFGTLAILFSRYLEEDDGVKVIPKSLGQNNTILFLSNSEPGLANVLIATAHALAVEFPHTEVHYASYPKLTKTIESISKAAMKSSAEVHPITFHPLKGPSYSEALHNLSKFGAGLENIIQRPGIAGVAHLCSNMQDMLMPWSGPDYLETYQDVLRLLDEVHPSAVAVDSMFGPGLEYVIFSEVADPIPLILAFVLLL
jgi:hypothetical protein